MRTFSDSPLAGVMMLKNTKLKKCKYCGIEVNAGSYARFHGINCKKAFAKKATDKDTLPEGEENGTGKTS